MLPMLHAKFRVRFRKVGNGQAMNHFVECCGMTEDDILQQLDDYIATIEEEGWEAIVVEEL